MIELQVLDYLRNLNEPVAGVAIAETFGVTSSKLNRYLQIYQESGDVKCIQIQGRAHYHAAPKKEGEVVPPRTAPTFKSLKSIPSALGTREGSNDHLQHKSKHI